MRRTRLIALLLLVGTTIPAWAADAPTAGPATGQTQETPKPPDYHCPPTAYINCLPPISDDRRQPCAKDYIAWVQAHCPNRQVVY